MANQLTLAFSVATASTIYTPAQAAAKLAAVPLYASAGADPVLGQAFGLTVASDVVSTGGVTYSGEAGGPFQPGETVTGGTSHATATIAVDEDNGVLFFVAGSESGGPFSVGETVTGGTSIATATVVLPAAGGGSTSATPGPTSTTPGATRVLTLNMTAALSAPYAPPPFPCRPTGPLEPPPGAPYAQGAMSYSETVLTASNTSPIVIGVSSTEGLEDGMVVTVVGALGNTAANGSFTIAALTGDSFTLVDSVGNGAYTGGGVVAIPYTLTDTTENPYTRRPQTLPAPAAVAAFYSTSDLDTDGVATTPAIPAGAGAQIMQLTYLDSTGAGPFTVYTKLMGKFPAMVTLAGGSVDIAEIIECLVEQTGAFDNSVGQITLCALEAPLSAIPANATPADFPDLTDAAQLTITRPLIYLPPSYFALAQQPASAPQLAGDFVVKKDSPTVLTPVSQVGVVAATHTIEFASQPGVVYEVASVSATFVKLTTPYTGLSRPEIAPAAEKSRYAQSVSTEADAVVTSACLVSPSQVAPPDSAHLLTLLSEFTLPQTTAPALTYVAESGPFTPTETVVGQKSRGTGVVLYDDQGVNSAGLLAFAPGSVKSGFVKGETVTGQTSGATATVVVPRTLASSPLPTRLSGLYARTLSLVLGAPVVSQPITLV